MTSDREWHREWAEREGSIEELDEKYHDHLPPNTNCHACGVEHAEINPE